MNTSLLILPHIIINNANAWSSPYTVGFPSLTSIGGAVHCLQRKICSCCFPSIAFKNFGVVSHKFNLRESRSGYDSSIVLTGNPLVKDKKNPQKYTRPPFIAEIKCQMDMSLIIEFEGDVNESSDLGNGFIELIISTLHDSMRISSGDVISFDRPRLIFHANEPKVFRQKIVGLLMPGYALIERKDLVKNSLDNQNDALDSLLDSLVINFEKDSAGTKNHKGWLVPICTGYMGVTSIVPHALNQRDDCTPHRFVESMVTLGEFRMLHKFKEIRELLWRSNYIEKDNYYVYEQFDNSSLMDDELDEDFFI